MNPSSHSQPRKHRASGLIAGLVVALTFSGAFAGTVWQQMKMTSYDDEVIAVAGELPSGNGIIPPDTNGQTASPSAVRPEVRTANTSPASGEPVIAPSWSDTTGTPPVMQKSSTKD